MSRMILGDCISTMAEYPDQSIDFILTDPPYLVGYTDRSGRTIENDKNDAWLMPAFAACYRLLKPDTLAVSFYGWTAVDKFFAAWKKAGFRVVGHLVFTKSYSSKARYLAYQHESAFVLAKGRPATPAKPLPDVMPWKYSGNHHHPTEKPVSSLTPIIESFSKPGDIILDPFAGSGSTCVAAAQSGRRYIGIELRPEYHTAALSRLGGLCQQRAA